MLVTVVYNITQIHTSKGSENNHGDEEELFGWVPLVRHLLDQNATEVLPIYLLREASDGLLVQNTF